MWDKIKNLVRKWLGINLPEEQQPGERFARDYEFDGKTSTASTAIKSSSYVVLHKLNNEGLIFDAKLADSFAHAYETPQEARAFVKKYRLKY